MKTYTLSIYEEGNLLATASGDVTEGMTDVALPPIPGEGESTETTEVLPTADQEFAVIKNQYGIPDDESDEARDAFLGTLDDTTLYELTKTLIYFFGKWNPAFNAQEKIDQIVLVQGDRAAIIEILLAVVAENKPATE
jgi:hypothetical protein